MVTFFYFVFTLFHIAFLIWGIRLFQQRRSVGMFLVLLVSTGLVYDNLITAVGIFMGEGSVLLSLNVPRFYIHAFLTPVIILSALFMVQRTGVKWVQNIGVVAVFSIITVGLIGMGVAELVELDLHPACIGGSLRYAANVSEGQLCSPTQAVVESDGPPIPAILTIIILGVFGGFIWARGQSRWLFIGALVMFIGSAVPPSLVGPTVGSAVEVVLFAGLLMTEAWLQRVGDAVEEVGDVAVA